MFKEYAAPLERIQPTYEELKPVVGLQGTFAELSIQPTYEELKPASRVSRPL